MTRRHHHPMHDQRGLASVEHTHPGADRQHVHAGQPKLGPSTDQDTMLTAMKLAAARAGVRLDIPE